MTTFFISGASRGLGLGLVAHYATTSDTRVFAAARKPVDGELGKLIANSSGRVIPVALDVDDAASIAAAAESVRATAATIDILINCAGIGFANDATLTEVMPDAFMAVLRTNAAGPLLVTKALRDSLKRGSRIVNITSRLGSIAGADGSWGFAYPASKAALNMISKQLAEMLGGDGITVLALHPGWVQTDMGGSTGGKPPLTVEQSVAGMTHVIDKLSPRDNGTFLQWDGSTLPW